MQIRKKQLLGFGGLALVVGMTAIATTLPTSAVSSAEGNADIYVQVYDVDFSTKIEKPLDGDIYTSSVVNFSELHSHSYNTKYYLVNVANEKTYELSEYEVIGDDVNGITNFTLDLDNYGGPGVYKFHSVITGLNGVEKHGWSQFTYAAIEARQDDVSSSTEKVNFRVYYTAGVKSLTYQIYDADGKAVSGAYSVITNDPENGGYMDIEQALKDFDLASGTYTIKITGYETVDATGEIVGIATVTFKYTAPDSPNVPDTGSLLAALNISKTDYLVTSLICFLAISLVALFVIRKHKKSA